ncbi:hypothetical protein PROFUN_03807 [Planoprotostelium fungivorum]|uniref:Uncharacterized protein n=1 Tax=Planoprotostelium fungivorum TaxID=1890364 RepID=A0A2P6NI92_9EUKA|nr:hypothetical protein PROFUN_03807 [Planoprotostelium fungivorum]
MSTLYLEPVETPPAPSAALRFISGPSCYQCWGKELQDDHGSWPKYAYRTSICGELSLYVVFEALGKKVVSKRSLRAAQGDEWRITDLRNLKVPLRDSFFEKDDASPPVRRSGTNKPTEMTITFHLIQGGKSVDHCPTKMKVASKPYNFPEGAQQGRRRKYRSKKRVQMYRDDGMQGALMLPQTPASFQEISFEEILFEEANQDEGSLDFLSQIFV